MSSAREALARALRKLAARVQPGGDRCPECGSLAYAVALARADTAFITLVRVAGALARRGVMDNEVWVHLRAWEDLERRCGRL